MKKLLVVLAILAGLIFSGCVRENEMADPVIFVHCYDYGTSDYAIWGFDAEGVFVNKWTTPEWPQENCMCVDSSRNVYMVDVAGGSWDVIKKWDKNGNLLKSKTTDWTEGIAIGPDGYLYTRQLGIEEFGETHVIVKRDPDDLTVIDYMVMASTERVFTFGSSGYFYIEDTVGVDEVEKWAFGDAARTAFCDMPGQYGWPSSAYANGLIAILAGGGMVMKTIPTSLDEAWTGWDLSADMSELIHVAAISNDFLVAGYNNIDKYYKLGKYTSAGVKIWLVNIEHTDNITVYGIAAYPFYVVDKEAPWKEDTLEPTGEVKVEIPRRSGEWTTLEDVMRIHTSNGKDTSSSRAPIEIGQAEVTCSNISRNFNSFEEASDWYKNLEGYAVQIKVGCKIEGSPINVKLFTGIISSVDIDRLSQTAEIRVVDFLDYFGRITIEETPVWEGISLTQLFKNLVQLAFPEWVEGTDYFVEDLGGSTIPAIGYTDLNLLSELKMIAESRGMRLYTDTSGRLHCASRNPERDPLTVKHDYNLEDVTERRDIDSIINWVVVHARPHEIGYEPTSEVDETGKAVLGPDVTPPGKVAGFTATPEANGYVLTWSNPTDDDFELVRILSKSSVSGGYYPLNPDDGPSLYEGALETYEKGGLADGQRLFFSAFTKDTTGNWSEAAHTSCVVGAGGDTWEDNTGSSEVSAFRAEPGSGRVILTWRNPNVANFSKVKVRYSTTGYPSSESAGSAVYEGTAETTTHSGLTNGMRYYYSLFVQNTASKWSGASFASAIPAGARQLIQIQTISGYGILGPQTGAYGTSYTKTVLLAFRGLGGKYSTDWLRFKHEWDVKVDSGPAYSSNQKHEYGENNDLALSFTKNIGGIASVTVTEIRVTTSEVQVQYRLSYTGGKALSIRFTNKLSLWG